MLIVARSTVPPDVAIFYTVLCSTIQLNHSGDLSPKWLTYSWSANMTSIVWFKNREVLDQSSFKKFEIWKETETLEIQLCVWSERWWINVCVRLIYTHIYRERVCIQWSLQGLNLYTDFISTIQIKACLFMKHLSTAWMLPFGREVILKY